MAKTLTPVRLENDELKLLKAEAQKRRVPLAIIIREKIRAGINNIPKKGKQ